MTSKDMLQEAIKRVESNGSRANEWIWRLVVDHGYLWKDIKPEIDAAFKRWRRTKSESGPEYEY